MIVDKNNLNLIFEPLGSLVLIKDSLLLWSLETGHSFWMVISCYPVLNGPRRVVFSLLDDELTRWRCHYSLADGRRVSIFHLRHWRGGQKINWSEKVDLLTLKNKNREERKRGKILQNIYQRSTFRTTFQNVAVLYFGAEEDDAISSTPSHSLLSHSHYLAERRFSGLLMLLSGPLWLLSDRWILFFSLKFPLQNIPSPVNYSTEISSRATPLLAENYSHQMIIIW